MKIETIHLVNFKRFTDILIRNIPQSTRLVLIVGPNGSGKSSLFDAFLAWYRTKFNFGLNLDEKYYRKSTDHPFRGPQGDVAITFHDNVQPQKGSFYIRSAYRNDPDFSISSFGRPESPSETVRLSRAIDNDQTVAANYQRLVYETMSGVYDTNNDEKSVRDLREQLIGQIRESMSRVFGDLTLNSISDPLSAGSFFFEKGTTESYHYKNLSGGEKAAFDLILDLHLKKKFLPSAIYCIDEIETHIHTKVQGALLKEIYRIIPDDSQLWITTHSLGVLRAAQELSTEYPQSVALLDFTIDSDIPQELTASNLDRVTWEKFMSIALDDLSPRLAPSIIVVCEGTSLGGSRRKDFDAVIYETVLTTQSPDVVFVSGGSADQLSTVGTSVQVILSRLLPNCRVVALSDRDDRSDEEVEQLFRQGTITLPLRNLECYLFQDDVIEALVRRENQIDKLPEALAIKERALERSVERGNRPDDLKSASGPIYVGLKNLLQLTRCGNTVDAFMRDTLAPLVRPGSATYQALQEAVIDQARRLAST